MFSYGLKIGACVIALGFGTYLYGISFSKCIKHNLFAINRSAQDETERNEIWNQLIEFIEFHSRAKQLRKFFSNKHFQLYFNLKMNKIKKHHFSGN